MSSIVTEGLRPSVTWFLVIILPAILIRLAIYSEEMALSEDLAALLTIISKIGMIIVTIWYGLKIGIKWAWVLGFSTLLPLMTWVFLFILLSRKVEKIGQFDHGTQGVKQNRE